ncbi:MAG TPA: heme-binding protein [Gemmatimonadaceae bacterium]|nr:heme-binding protein [Gemmatimonadaceae bacterium]
MSDMIRPPFKDILQSIPGVFGIRLEEEPAYTVLDTIGDVEIRRYAPALLAQVTVRGDHEHALNESFNILARYIYGKNAEDATLHMTSPVFQAPTAGDDASTTPMLRDADGDAWTVAFFLSNDLLPEEAPQPEDPAVQLVMRPQTTIGSLRFTGNNTEARRAESKRTLLETLTRDGRWRVIDDVSWAQYDQPFAVPFLKRNEAHAELEEITNAS